MPTSVRDDLARLSGRASGKRGGTVMVTVIGSLMRDQETGRLVAMQRSCPAFVVWTLGVG